MRLESINKIGVIGAGIMGHNIALSFLMGNYPVTLFDVDSSVLESAREKIKKKQGAFY
jgi:3-hydroxybutyryl-CoA dehydrogenase